MNRSGEVSVEMPEALPTDGSVDSERSSTIEEHAGVHSTSHPCTVTVPVCLHQPECGPQGSDVQLLDCYDINHYWNIYAKS